MADATGETKEPLRVAFDGRKAYFSPDRLALRLLANSLT
jgi:hypothetical protein